MRRATGAPWYVRNDQLHIDLNLPTIRQFMKKAAKRFFDAAHSYPNPLVASAARYTPSQISRIRRPGIHSRMKTTKLTSIKSASVWLRKQPLPHTTDHPTAHAGGESRCVDPFRILPYPCSCQLTLSQHYLSCPYILRTRFSKFPLASLPATP